MRKYETTEKNTMKLPEEIGKGLNLEHYKKVKKAREVKNVITTFRTSQTTKSKLELLAKKYKTTVSNLITIGIESVFKQLEE